MIWSVFQTVAAVAVSSARPQHSSIPTSRSILSAQSSNIIRVHSIQPYKTTIAYYCLWLVTSSLTSSSSSWLNLRGVVAAPTSTDRRICSWKNLDRNSRFYSTSNTRSSFSGSSRSRIHRFGQRQQKQQQYSRRTMSSFLTRRTEGTITVAPKIEGDQSALVVIAHGLGDTAEGFADVAEVRVYIYDMS
jgi:hypothetical protein